MVEARPFQQTHAFAPFADVRYVTEDDVPTRLWHELRELADIPSAGHALFSGTISQKRARLAEFRSYVQQARAYDHAATLVEDRSAGLLLYYSALNLAKAELLCHDPSLIEGQKLGHGLSFNPATSSGVGTDFITVQAGVFRLLYEKRTGKTIPVQRKIPIRRLLCQAPEIAGEVAQTGLGTTSTVGAIHASATDGESAWGLVLCLQNGDFFNFTVSSKRFRSIFEEVEVPSNYSQIFGLSSRYGRLMNWKFFQSRTTVPYSINWSSDARDQTINKAGDLIDSPVWRAEDFRLYPSLYKSREEAMPPTLARYALIFYLSSLVRYRPSNLDTYRHPEFAWLFDELVRYARQLLIQSAVAGIKGREGIYFSAVETRA